MEIQALGYLGFGAGTSTTGRISPPRASACRRSTAAPGCAPSAWTIAGSGWWPMPPCPRARATIGWEVADAAALDALAARLERAGVAVKRETAALADQRCVSGLISFADPAGNRLEAFHGAQVADTPFQPGPHDLRLPHRAARHGPCPDDDRRTSRPRSASTATCSASASATSCARRSSAYFMHVNARHHSLALVEAPARHAAPPDGRAVFAWTMSGRATTWRWPMAPSASWRRWDDTPTIS